MKSVLCIGDSLTYGMLMNGYSQAFPYTQFLPKNIIYQNEGVCGETSGQITFRLSQLLAEKKYDYVILLAGTNDLGYSIDVERIISTLRYAYSIINKSAAKLISVTLPDSRWTNKDRDKVNVWIREYPECYAMLDLNKIIDTVKHLSIDGLHLNQQGYKLFGESISVILLAEH